jgi:hypothetical protein
MPSSFSSSPCHPDDSAVDLRLPGFDGYGADLLLSVETLKLDPQQTLVKTIVDEGW